jgi:hypothetical protein
MEWKTEPPIPKPNTTIWRYMSRRVFHILLNERRLDFHQFKDLQKIDAREGMVVPGFWESVIEYYRQHHPNQTVAELRAMGERSLDRIRCFAYANCWNMAKSENVLMWKAYARKGIAIRTTVRRFRTAPRVMAEDRFNIQLQKITYADHWRELERRGYRHNGIPLNKLFIHTKRKAFTGERELRFRISPVFPFPYNIPGPRGGFMQDASRCPAWFPVIFENLDWIQEVVAESSISGRTATAIRRLVEQHNLKFRISGI